MCFRTTELYLSFNYLNTNCLCSLTKLMCFEVILNVTLNGLCQMLNVYFVSITVESQPNPGPKGFLHSLIKLSYLFQLSVTVIH